ncbi:peptidylprolyl isomerase [Salibaculum sp.]|uniref:peptidylprolyl isomerase n=1 Tax=Salibaculum sp. TaxID=2855480 RepID=UPI002B46DA86|nr:peptidylprolyl isomerase [Salibaculum sp.]HKL69758.1 peptidylprolyl isomerase [Salibaculum sp.]
MRAVLILLALLVPVALPAQAQFSPAITVNDKAITPFEIEQRERMLEVFRTPGDLADLAREQLIEERLKAQELERAGLRLTEEGLQRAMTDFAARADQDLDQFLTVLRQNGIEEESMRDFVRINATWRDYIRQRYDSRARVTEAEVDRALGRSEGGAGIQVLLNEIIIPAPPERAEAAMQRAEQISELTSFSAFESEASRVSALPSRERGGRLDWLPISNFPAPLRPIFLGLAPGEVTDPLPIENGIALFQLRDLREVTRGTPAPAEIDYAAYYIDGGLSEQALDRAARVAGRVDTCDDLYGVARDQPPRVLERNALPPDEIPQDVAVELAKLDPGETSWGLTRAGGDTLVLLMLCGRTPAENGAQDRDAVRNQLRSQRLSGYAEALLAELRASARITGN